MKHLLFVVLLFLAVPALAETVREVSVEGDRVTVSYKQDDEEMAREVFDNDGNLLDRAGSIPDGTVRQYAANGQVVGEWQYKDGRKNGVTKRYTEKGRLKSEVSYRAGRRDGVSREYASDGTPREEARYSNGKLDGIAKVYLSNGHLFSEITYKNNVRNGLSRTYYEDGRIAEEANFVDGQREGVSTTYFDASPQKTETAAVYKNGKLAELKTYAPDGKLKSSQDFSVTPSSR